MSFPIEMPQLSSDGDSGDAAGGGGATLASWLVSPGDAVDKGDVIAELETDKATLELEAPASGTIAELLVEAGTEGVAPGTVLGTIEAGDQTADAAGDQIADAAGDEIADAAGDEIADEAGDPAGGTAEGTAGETSRADGAEAIAEDSMAARTTSEPAAPPEDDDARRASTPLARRAAAGLGLDLGRLEGTGPRGRIVEADVLRAAGPRTPGEGPEASAGPRAAGSPPRRRRARARRSRWRPPSRSGDSRRCVARSPGA